MAHLGLGWSCRTSSRSTSSSKCTPCPLPGRQLCKQPWQQQRNSSSLTAGTASSHSPGLSSASSSLETPSSSSSSTRLRQLILLRHADSESDSWKGRDHDRPISREGKQQAAKVAQKLCLKNWVPDLVLASNAKRTIQTLEEMAIVMKQLNKVEHHYYGSLYTFSALVSKPRPPHPTGPPGPHSAGPPPLWSPPHAPTPLTTPP